MISPEKIAEMLAAAEHVPNGEWTLDGHEIIASRRYPIATVDRHSRDAEAIKAYLLLCHPDAISDLLAEVTSNRSELLTLRTERDEADKAATAMSSDLFDMAAKLAAAEAQLARQGEVLKAMIAFVTMIDDAPHPETTSGSHRSAEGRAQLAYAVIDNLKRQAKDLRARSTLSPEAPSNDTP